MPNATFAHTESIDTGRLQQQFLQVIHGVLPFHFVYQPIVDLRRNDIAGYEALVRFPDEIGLAPDKCFLLAERLGLRQKLEHVVLTQAFQSRHTLPSDTLLTINASPSFLLSDEWLQTISQQHSLEGIVIEITEQDSIEDYEAMRSRTTAIRDLGGYIAVDDTGAGYASMKHMMELAPNFLKLDRYFVGDCHAMRAKATLIEMIARVASSMDAWIIAEGVETGEDLDELIRLSVPLVQGYHLARPDREMQPLSAATKTSLQKRQQALVQTKALHREMESCDTFRNAAEASAFLRQSPNGRFAVVLDQWSRPTKMMERHPLIGTREIRELMSVQIQSNLEEALRRGLTRSEASRFDAMAVINEQGRFQGILRMDKIMHAVLAVPTDLLHVPEPLPAS